MENKEIDKLFKEALEAAEATPNDKVWQGIEAALDQEKENIVPIARQRKLHWTYYAAAASVLLALGVVVWTIQYAENVHPKDTSLAQHVPTQPVQTPEDIAPGTSLSSATEIIGQPTPETVQEHTVSYTHAIEKPTPATSEPRVTELPKLEMRGIQEAGSDRLQSLATLNATTELPTYRVTEIEEIKPLIEPEEEMESMYAASDPYNKSTIVTSLLNSISENMESNSGREVRFRADEEGSIRIDFLNSLVKNRNKKKR